MAFHASAVFWVGVVLIFVYALERFNTPPTNRPSTTWLRYHTAAMVYVGLFEVTFAVIARYPQLIGYLHAWVPDLSERLSRIAADSTDPESLTVGIAVLLSVLVPKVPGLARIDRSLRDTLQRAAAIPYEARRFAKAIQGADFQPAPGLQQAIRSRYEKTGLDRVVNLDDVDAAAQSLHRLTAMMVTLEQWETDRRFSGFLDERREQYARLRDRYARLSEMAKGYFELSSKTPDVAGNGTLDAVAEKFRQGFEEESDNLILEAAELISHTLLKCCVRAAPRMEELHGMGLWPAEEAHHGMTADQVTMLLGALMLVVLLYSALLSDVSQADTLTRIAMIPIIYTVAVICAVVPKQHWPVFRRASGAPPPAFGYALSGLAAASLALMVALTFRTLLMLKGMDLPEAFVEALVSFRDRSSPWLLMSFATAVGTAAVIDSEHLAGLEPERLRRAAESGAMALLLAGTGLFVWWLIDDLRSGTSDSAPPLAGVLVVSGLLGALIGYMVPHWYRGSPTPAAQRALLQHP